MDRCHWLYGTQLFEGLKINRITSTPYHPSENRQAETTNKTLIQNNNMLEHAKGKWLQEQPGVLWAYRTTSKASIRETPFSLDYNAEALIIVEIREPSIRWTQTTKKSNFEAMTIEVNLLEEVRHHSRPNYGAK